jgi:hypothetical protein
MTLGPVPGGWLECRGDAPLRTGDLTLGFSVREILRDDGAALRIAASRSTLFVQGTGREILAHHVHGGPFGEGHYHIGQGAGDLIAPLHKLHLPAEHTDLSDLLRMLIRDFGLPPQRGDWERILAK